MAEVPIPRSFNQIVGEMVDALLSRLGIPSLRVGSPALSIIEAAGQSDLRSSQDIFNLLNSMSLDRAQGLALDRIGNDEQAPRIPESPSSGVVTVTDTSFTKLQTRIFQGLGAPIVGSQAINVDDALSFPATGSVYLGRGTTNLEGPIAYTSKVNNGTYWTLNLSSGTQRYHNLGETVILAQGGDRTVAAGTIVQTPPGNVGTSIQFSVLYAAVIPDGETEINGVTVICQTAGTVGKVIANSIREFLTLPFTGAAVTNPAPFNNGLDTEDDDSYRERIRSLRSSRSKGTVLAIKTGTVGITALDENKRVLSASVLQRQDEPVALVIDDGTGYEERSDGIAFEIVAESAVGGEQYFQLAQGRPVAKAQLETTLTAPFALVAGSQLAVAVGGIRSNHVFSGDSFQSIVNASAFEVVASINGNPNLLWSARTVENGTKVAVFAKADTNEDVEILAADPGLVDANLYLGFPSGRVDSLRLYLNDRLLTKDGSLATLTSKSQGLWDAGAIVSGATLQISVDGINISSLATVVDSDFVNAGTSYTSVSANNSLSSWAQVWNYKLPGVTASVNGGTLVFTSNSGRSNRASLNISGGSLAQAMWGQGQSQGQDSDYSLDRNLGQIKLQSSLAADDRLSAGSLNTRGFVESPSFQTLTVSSEATSVAGQDGAEIWVVVDGAAVSVKTGIGPGTSIQVSLTASPSWGKRVRYTGTAAIFSNTVVGDWIVVTDLALNQNNRGAFRVARVDGSGFWVEVERPSSWSQVEGPLNLGTGGIKVVRTEVEPQRLFVDASGSPYTALSLVNALQPQLQGATAEIYRTTRVRIRTNTFGESGDIDVVAANGQGVALGFPVSVLETGGISHLASVVAGHPETGTPAFQVAGITSVSSSTVFTVAALNGINSGSVVVGLRALPDTGPLSRYSNKNHVTTIDHITGTTLTTRRGALESWLPSDRIYGSHAYDISPRDQLAVTVDGDEVSKRYVMNMYRRVKPGSSSYGASNDFTDPDNGNSSLAKAFGLNFNWKDFAVFMKARVKAENILWRYYRHGPEGNWARVQYNYPVAAGAAAAVVTDVLSGPNTNVIIKLPAGAARTGVQYRNSTRLGSIIQGPDGNSLYTYTFFMHLVASSASRTSNVTTVTLTLPSPVTDHGLQVGQAIWFQSLSGSFSTGTKVITARSTTTISYAEVNADVGATANPGRVSSDAAGEVSFNGSNVVSGDLFHALVPALFTVKLQSLSDDRSTAQYPSILYGGVGTVINWTPIQNTTNLSWFPVGAANTQSAIVSAVNTLTAIVSGTDLGGGSPISDATYEASVLGGSDPWYYLTDGLNWVRSNTNPVLLTQNYNFTFKDAVAAGLASGSDWANEDVRLVPITAQNLVDFMDSPGAGGLFSVTEIAIADGARSPQITSITPGTSGSISIGGGSSNSVSASIRGGSVLVSGGTAVSSIDVAEADGLSGNSWVSLTNTVTAPKDIIGPTTQLTSISGVGVVTLAVTPAWTWAGTAGDGGTGVYDNRAWQIERQGDFVAFVYAFGGSSPDFTGINEGDWVIIGAATTPASGSGQANSLNLGQFRVVRVDNTAKIFWIENRDAVEEVASVRLGFYDYDSIVPGDSLVINTSLWGSGNLGTWTVASIDPSNSFRFTLDVSSRTPETVGAVGALGSNSSLIQVYEGKPSRLIKQIQAISTNPSNSTLSDLKFVTGSGYRNIGAGFGTVLVALDKMQLGIDPETDISQPLVIGADGYRHNTGLIEEANKVVYGDEADTSTYPGIAAAGAQININGPLVRRIQISLALRVKTGISTTDIEDKVKSGVAAVINGTDVGVSVAISDLVAAAQDVNGVVAVTVLSPSYGSGSDLIAVQPQEKPLVVNVDQDILVSFVGT